MRFIFILFNVIPADPAKMMLGERDDARQLEKIRKKYNLDKKYIYDIIEYNQYDVVLTKYDENDEQAILPMSEGDQDDPESIKDTQEDEKEKNLI